MNLILILVGFVAGVLVGRNNPDVVESVVAFAKRIAKKIKKN